MRTNAGTLVAGGLTLLFAVLPAPSKEKGTIAPMDEKPFTHAVDRWLVLGPVADALPLFHEEDRGKFGIDELLKAERGPSPRSRPAPGDVVPWPTGVPLTWSTAVSAKDARVELPTQATNEGKGYASAWLAS